VSQRGEIAMTSRLRNFAAKLVREDNGQTIVMFSLLLVVMLAAAGFAIDVGRAMVVNSKLQSSTVAAALAGANEMPNSDFATVAMKYSACTAPPAGSNITTGCTTNQSNASSLLGTVTTSTAGYCSSFVKNTLDVLCTSMGTSSVNALVVTQTATMPTMFMRIFGINSITFSDSQTAAWRGSSRNPYNVAVVVDATGSMNAEDSGSDGCNSSSAFACALLGVQTLLEHLTPCAGGGSCGTGYTPLDEVSLYAFPGLSNSSAVSDDINCKAVIEPANYYHSSDGGYGENDSTVYYGFPNSTASVSNGPLPSPGPIYQLVGFSSDYRSSDTSSSLNSSSTLVTAVGGGGASACADVAGHYYYQYGGTGWSRHGETYVPTWAGIQAAGGADTYYAGVIYQAQNDLYNQYASRLTAGTQTTNVMVILSDGDASSDAADLGGEVLSNNQPTCSSYYYSQCQSYVWPNTNQSGSYASYYDPCSQAVTAAEAATNGTFPSTNTSKVPTTVYTVAYGSETGDCTNDTITPCQTMARMASSYTLNQSNPTLYPNAQLDFYSDYLDTATGGADNTCTSSNGITNIQDIFQDIAASMSVSKIMVNPSGCTASNTASCN
jgi:Flp pilus assembly protein TadG